MDAQYAIIMGFAKSAAGAVPEESATARSLKDSMWLSHRPKERS